MIQYLLVSKRHDRISSSDRVANIFKILGRIREKGSVPNRTNNLTSLISIELQSHQVIIGNPNVFIIIGHASQRKMRSTSLRHTNCRCLAVALRSTIA